MEEVTMPPIRVLFDQQIFLLQSFGGISRYFTELIKTYIEHPELGIVPVVESKKTFNRHLSEELAAQGFSSDNSRFRSFLRIVFGGLLARNRKAETDLCHLTFYLPGYFSRNKTLPKVVTLFDMIPERAPAKGKLWNPHFEKRQFLTQADAVVSISETSTKDMRREFGIERQTPTTYLGVSAEFAPNLEVLEGAPETYLLYVGARFGYKDAGTAISAFAKISESFPNLHLLFIGGGALSSREKKHFRQLGISAQVAQLAVSDSELPRIYSNAVALIYPSTYEGFGLPLVEAMASGIPILASDTEINREIARDVANYFPAGDFSALASGLQVILADPSSQRTKIEVGILRSKDFSWLECARQTAEVYKAVMQTGTAKD
jgi:glycosyltransferase involved in cell wall biosynthesis